MIFLKLQLQNIATHTFWGITPHTLLHFYSHILISPFLKPTYELCSTSYNYFDGWKPHSLELLGYSAKYNNLYMLRSYIHHTSCFNYTYILLASEGTTPRPPASEIHYWPLSQKTLNPLLIPALHLCSVTKNNLRQWLL